MQNTVDGVFTLFRGDFNLHHLIHDHTTCRNSLPCR
ncbi:Uncharacterised protein [Vibrio cholerae]|nr:Uncharacterised protein [Vibrio cholerae]